MPVLSEILLSSVWIVSEAHLSGPFVVRAESLYGAVELSASPGTFL